MRHWSSCWLAVAVGAVLVLGVGGAQAGSGELDPSFGSGGVVVTSFGGDDFGNAIAIQPDGKIVAAGFSDPEGYYAPPVFALSRYNPDGSLDAGFGTGGKVVSDLGGGEDFGGAAYAVAVQQDGKIVAVGFTEPVSGGPRDFALARFQPDGTLDASFGNGGIVLTNSGGSGEAWGVAIQSDGKIVVVGGGGTQDYDFVLARYTTEGALDTTFGSGGIVVTDIAGAGRMDVARAVAIQQDGKIVAVGSSYASAGDVYFALARYNPDGSLDAGFGPGGAVLTLSGRDVGGASAVAIQQDGRIVAAGEGTLDFPSGSDFMLARYDADGTLDSSFGQGGIVLTNPGGAGGVAIQPNGKIVAAGGGEEGFALARYEPNGTLDTSFGQDGIAGGPQGGAAAVAIEPDGKLVAGGTCCSWSDPGSSFVLARYIAGPVVTSFTPTQGRAGTRVQIEGLHFSGATAVSFNGTNAKAFSVESDTRITAKVPIGATSGPINVTTPATSGMSSDSFSMPAPMIKNFSPQKGRVGRKVSIGGIGFTGATAVAFNGIAAAVTVKSDKKITTIVPAGATSGRITVTTATALLLTSPKTFTVT
jgi:uncharacterized delta-60 repeat protein